MDRKGFITNWKKPEWPKCKLCGGDLYGGKLGNMNLKICMSKGCKKNMKGKDLAAIAEYNRLSTGE